MSTSVNGNEPLSSQDRTKGLAEGVTIPAATARHSVLVGPGDTIPIIRPPPPPNFPYTFAGSTANFNITYESTLPEGEAALADAILGRCEQDLSQLRNIFGGVSAGPFSVFIDQGTPGQRGTPGAYHLGCGGTAIYCNVDYETDGDLANFLNCAEVAEVLMNNQSKGWNCAWSAGEGLSRVLATELHPASLGQFASASHWLNSRTLNWVNPTMPQRPPGPGPDWVTQTEGTDTDYVSIGCATLFINYLRYHLHFSLAQIVQAGGTTLQQTHERLTGSTNAFEPFFSLLEARFPLGVTVNLPNDNPFVTVPDVIGELAGSARMDLISIGLVPTFAGAGPVVKEQKPDPGEMVSWGTIVALTLGPGEPK